MTGVAADTPPTDAKSREELAAAAAHGLRWSAIARPATEVIQLGSVVILARLIVPAEFGRVAIALIAQEVAYLVVSGGLSAALVQRKTLDREHLQSGTALALLAGFALAVLTLIAALVVVGPVFGSRTAVFVAMMAPLCLVSAMGTVPAANLQRKMAFRRLSEAEVVGTFVRAAACVALALAGLEGEALVLGLLAGAVTMAMILWFSAPPPLPRLHRRAARELLAYGLPASMATVSWVGFSNIDYAIIGARLGAYQTGLYFRAYTVAVEYQSKIAMVMGSVGFPVLARTPTHAELTRLYRQMIGLLSTVLFPLLVLLAISAPVAVPFFFGPRWGAAIEPVQILCLGGAATLIANAAGTVLMASGRARALLGFGVAHFLTYGLTVLLVVHLGIVAVAIAAAIVHSVFAVVAYTTMLRGSGEHPLRRLWEDIGPAAVSCVGLAAVALPAGAALTAAHVPAAIWLGLVGLAALAAYALMLWVCFRSTWRTLRSGLDRVLPGKLRLPGRRPRVPVAQARPSA
jgi:lipopolysaccharide exporter